MKTPAEEKLDALKNKFGAVNKIGDGRSLFHIPAADIIVYFRYSRITEGRVPYAFYGLRRKDVDLMVKQGKTSFLFLLTDQPDKNAFVPFKRFESYFANVEASADGQYKVLHFFRDSGRELYFANIGKFSSESFTHMETVLMFPTEQKTIPELSHGQAQSLVGSIGIHKGYGLFFPKRDYAEIDRSIVDFSKVKELPFFNSEVNGIISEVDVIWLKGSSPFSLFEVEHTTPIYSGLLRFNDVLLSVAGIDNFNVVSHSEKEGKFGREINRPTFKANNLMDKVTFLSYDSLYEWHRHLTGKAYDV